MAVEVVAVVLVGEVVLMVEVVMMAVGRTISSFSEAAPPQPWRTRRRERESPGPRYLVEGA